MSVRQDEPQIIGKNAYKIVFLSAVVWRCFSTIVIFLHLIEEKSSWLVLLPTGISALIEV